MFSLYSIYYVKAKAYASFHSMSDSKEDAVAMFRFIVKDAKMLHTATCSSSESWYKALGIAAGNSGYFTYCEFEITYEDVLKSEFIVYKTREEKIDLLLS